MNSSRNSFEMVVCSRFIILQSVVTRYLFVQKVVNCCKTKNYIRITSGYVCCFSGMGICSSRCFPDRRCESGDVGKGTASGESAGLYRKGITEHSQRHGSGICTKSGSNLERNPVRAGRTLESSDRRQGLEWYLRCD